MVGERYHKDPSVCAKSIQFDTLVVFDMLNRIGGSAKLNTHFLSKEC